MFLRYNFDDPTVEGDEETGSPKIGYAKGFPVPNSDQKLIVGFRDLPFRRRRRVSAFW